MQQTLYRYRLFAGLVLALLVAGPQHLAALGGIEGTFEYAIDAPWRMEPYTATNGEPTYGAIPLQITIHDAKDVKHDRFHRTQLGNNMLFNNVSQALDLGKVCRVIVTETSTNQSLAYIFQDFAEVEATQGAWLWPATSTPPTHTTCRAWQGDDCTPLQALSQTSEWHALLWHTPLSTPTPGDGLSLMVEVELTRHPGTSCTQPPTEEEFFSGITYRVPSVISLRNHLRVHYGEAPLPRFDDTQTQWLYGDLHYHSQGTDNEGESAYNYRGVIRAMGAMGIDFVVATEHASNSEQIIDGDISLDLDLPLPGDWNPLDLAEDGAGGVLRDMHRHRFAFHHDLLHGNGGVNQQAARLGATGLPPGALSHGVLPQIFLGGELDAVPEVLACSLEYPDLGEIDDVTDVFRIFEDFFPRMQYGNGLTYKLGKLCKGWLGQITTEDCSSDDLLHHTADGIVLIRDVQGINSFDFGREHLVYFPATAAPEVSGPSPYEPMCRLCEFCPGNGEDVCNCRLLTCTQCYAQEIPEANVCTPQPHLVNNSAFIPSSTGRFGGARRRLTAWLSDNPPLLPEIAWKGYAFLAHHLNDGDGEPGPDAPPWSRHMLQQAWRSPGILGLQFWNENARLSSKIDGQSETGGVEKGYERPKFVGQLAPTNHARSGFVIRAAEPPQFELIPYDVTTERWDKGNVPGIEHRLHHGAADWDHINLWGLDPAQTSELSWLVPGEPRRFFMAGGSDAHGDLNYRRAGYFLGTTETNDTAIGLPRNLVQVDRSAAVPAGDGNTPAVAYSHDTVAQALASGNFAVTDGPALRIVVDRNQNGVIDAEDTPMGGMVNLYGEETLPLLVEWKSTPEFGAVATIDLYVGVQGGASERTYAPYRHGTRGAGISPGLPSSVSGYTDNATGLHYVLLDDGYWHVTRTETTSLRISGSPDEEPESFPPPPDTPLPTNAYAGVRAVTLDLHAFQAAQNVPGERFFVRAFAQTHYQPCSLLSIHGACLRRYAFTNPVWAITQSDSGTCPEDPQALDRDEDGLPDGCDPEPEPVPPVGSACQSSAEEPPEVQVDLTTMSACGSLVGARDSADTTQYLTCRVQVLETDTAPYMVCEARDIQGDTLTCLGTGGYVDAVLGLPDYGYVHFTAADDAQGVKRCTSLEVGTFAPLLP